eukprot:CAMPEP_0184666184 /NCGR_PEP_ID=MMETSP0308-20130426/60320_1 /TAXON_ID=38269 /ORGANISM="Gloeochaete witrockiana, Strain SAG 46.84" /LENGTH=826 /DNA_ID=CAMNT_0027110631 /DNA_START=176 /DNA_END=2653 /DNA_ORIENTATION=+
MPNHASILASLHSTTIELFPWFEDSTEESNGWIQCFTSPCGKARLFAKNDSCGKFFFTKCIMDLPEIPVAVTSNLLYDTSSPSMKDKAALWNPAVKQSLLVEAVDNETQVYQHRVRVVPFLKVDAFVIGFRRTLPDGNLVGGTMAATEDKPVESWKLDPRALYSSFNGSTTRALEGGGSRVVFLAQEPYPVKWVPEKVHRKLFYSAWCCTLLRVRRYLIACFAGAPPSAHLLRISPRRFFLDPFRQKQDELQESGDDIYVQVSETVDNAPSVANELRMQNVEVCRAALSNQRNQVFATAEKLVESFNDIESLRLELEMVKLSRILAQPPSTCSSLSSTLSSSVSSSMSAFSASLTVPPTPPLPPPPSAISGPPSTPASTIVYHKANFSETSSYTASPDRHAISKWDQAECLDALDNRLAHGAGTYFPTVSDGMIPEDTDSFMADSASPSLTTLSPSGDGTADGVKLKPPPNPYILFCKDKRPQLISQLRNTHSTRQISQVLGDLWTKLDPVEKERYIKQAAEIKAEFQRKYPKIKFSRMKRRKPKDTASGDAAVAAAVLKVSASVVGSMSGPPAPQPSSRSSVSGVSTAAASMRTWSQPPSIAPKPSPAPAPVATSVEPARKYTRVDAKVGQKRSSIHQDSPVGGSATQHPSRAVIQSGSFSLPTNFFSLTAHHHSLAADPTSSHVHTFLPGSLFHPSDIQVPDAPNLFKDYHPSWSGTQSPQGVMPMSFSPSHPTVSPSRSLLSGNYDSSSCGSSVFTPNSSLFSTSSRAAAARAFGNEDVIFQHAQVQSQSQTNPYAEQTSSFIPSLFRPTNRVHPASVREHGW